jgi:hypothetical protein
MANAVPDRLKQEARKADDVVVWPDDDEEDDAPIAPRAGDMPVHFRPAVDEVNARNPPWHTKILPGITPITAVAFAAVATMVVLALFLWL